MKKVRIAKQYGEWYYEKQQDYDMEFPVYNFWNEEHTENYILGSYSDMLLCIKETTKELREKFERIYG